MELNNKKLITTTIYLVLYFGVCIVAYFVVFAGLNHELTVCKTHLVECVDTYNNNCIDFSSPFTYNTTDLFDYVAADGVKR